LFVKIIAPLLLAKDLSSPNRSSIEQEAFPFGSWSQDCLYFAQSLPIFGAKRSITRNSQGNANWAAGFRKKFCTRYEV